MMKLPSLDDLNHISQLIYRQNFEQIDDTRKLQMVAIAQQGVLAYVIDEIPLNLNIGLAESFVEHFPYKAMKEGFEKLEKQLEMLDWLSNIGEWFEKSRLYEP